MAYEWLPLNLPTFRLVGAVSSHSSQAVIGQACRREEDARANFSLKPSFGILYTGTAVTFPVSKRMSPYGQIPGNA